MDGDWRSVFLEFLETPGIEFSLLQNSPQDRSNYENVFWSEKIDASNGDLILVANSNHRFHPCYFQVGVNDLKALREDDIFDRFTYQQQAMFKGPDSAHVGVFACRGSLREADDRRVKIFVQNRALSCCIVFSGVAPNRSVRLINTVVVEPCTCRLVTVELEEKEALDVLTCSPVIIDQASKPSYQHLSCVCRITHRYIRGPLFCDFLIQVESNNRDSYRPPVIPGARTKVLRGSTSSGRPRGSLSCFPTPEQSCEQLHPEVWKHLPDAIFPEILARLPYVSMFHNRAVCKDFNIMQTTKEFQMLCRNLHHEQWIVFQPYTEVSSISRVSENQLNVETVEDTMLQSQAWCPLSGRSFRFPFIKSKLAKACINRNTRKPVDMEEVVGSMLRFPLDEKVLELKLGAWNLYVSMELDGTWIKLQNLNDPAEMGLEVLDVGMWEGVPVMAVSLVEHGALRSLSIWKLDEFRKQWKMLTILNPGTSEIWGSFACGPSVELHVEGEVWGSFVVFTSWPHVDITAALFFYAPVAYDLERKKWRFFSNRTLAHHVPQFSFQPSFEILMNWRCF